MRGAVLSAACAGTASAPDKVRGLRKEESGNYQAQKKVREGEEKSVCDGKGFKINEND